MDRLTALVLLRWRTDLRALMGARERVGGLLLLVPFVILGSALAAVFVFIGARALEAARPELVLPMISVSATAIGVFWALSPLLTGVAFSESHDMSRLLHFPIPLRTLVASSLVANLAQPMVLARLPLLVALAAALARRAALFPLALLGALITFAFMIAADQVTGLVLHGVSRNRRLQDAALFLGLGLGFLLSIAPVLLVAGGGHGIAALMRALTATDVFALSPFAWGVRAAVHAGRGELGPFLGDAALGLAAILAAMSVSAGLIQRIHRGALDLGGAPRGEAARARMIFPGDLGALVEKDLRVAWRDPALKATLLVGFLGPLFFLFLFSQTGAGGHWGRTLLFLASVVGVSTFGANAFGLERRGIGLLMAFPVPRWKILAGKNVAAMAFRLPGLLTLVLIGSLMAPPVYLPAALAIVVSTFLVASGLDNYMSILFPIVAPAAGKNPYGGGMAGGRGLGAAALGVILLFGAFLGASPFAFLAWLPLLLEVPSLWLVTLPLAVAGAAAVYAMLVAGAAQLLARREPELIQRILGEE